MSFCLSDLSPSHSSVQPQPSMRTVHYVSTTATPRPALTPSSTRSQTPTCLPSVPPEKSPYAGLCSSSRPGLHLRPNHKELSQSALDSSGYSSSEGIYRKPMVAASSSSRMSSNSGALSSGYRSRISGAFFRLMGEYWSVSVCLCFNVSVYDNILIPLFHMFVFFCRHSIIGGCQSTVKSNAPDILRYVVGVCVLVRLSVLARARACFYWHF